MIDPQDINTWNAPNVQTIITIAMWDRKIL